MFLARPLPPILNALGAGRSRADRISSATSSPATWSRTNLAAAYKRAFRPSQTATCILATPRPSNWISGSRRSFWGTRICASMTPILRRKRPSTSTPSRTVLDGWATTGMACTTLPTTSISSTSGPFSSSRREKRMWTTSPPMRSVNTAAL